MAGCEINTQKSVTFLYMTNEQSEKEIKRTILLSIKRTKYLHVNLSKEAKDFYMKTIRHY